jgi:hypothetical protein
VYPPGIIGQAEWMPITTRNGLLIAGAVAVVALMLGGLLIVVGSRSTPATSEADQVRAVLNRMNSSYNRSDFKAFASHVCADMLRSDAYETGWHQSRELDGPTQITVNSVDVTGDDAVANVQFTAANHSDAKTLDIDFFRDGTGWKACQYRASRSL